MKRFDKVLVANRGEIAVRVIRGARRLGCRTVAVYSDVDAESLYVRLADEAVRLGPAPAAESYLSIPLILEAARSSGAQAIHPGYGFLSERADFACAVRDAGLVYIGPDAASIETMGNKSAAKRLMVEAGVPCVPGYHGSEQSDESLLAEAKKIGLPVMVKAAAGGGGRGMRLVYDEKALLENIRSARSEADNAFGSGQLLIEKAVVDARHVEIQVFGDAHGNVIHLGERDCSIQRRNQKLVEETPSPVVDQVLRLKMGAAAVTAARAVSYVGAGTVEFLLDSQGRFYFLEMNTRLQVEHPVTEMVYCVDLVEWQLRIARNEALPMTQGEVMENRYGHAIEVRLCAEDPRQNYLPQTGNILRWQAPQGKGVRTDSYLESGTVVSPYYDSLQAKIIAWGEDREIARLRLLRALADTWMAGVVSNRDQLMSIIGQAEFVDGDFDNRFIQHHFPSTRLAETQPTELHRLLAALVLYLDDARQLSLRHALSDELLGWHSSHRSPIHLPLSWREHEFSIELEAATDRTCILALAEGRRQIVVLEFAEERLRYRCDGVDGCARFVRDGDTLWLDALGDIEAYRDRSGAPPAQSARAGGDGRLLSHSDGRIVSVLVQTGEQVKKGQTLMVLEAMKMEFQMAAPVGGTVGSIDVQPGQQIRCRQQLAHVEPVRRDPVRQ